MHTALLLEMAADGLGDRLALGSRVGGLSYAEELRSARAAAAWIAREPAETVAYVGLNSEAFPLALYAASLAGKPFAPLNYRLPDADLRKILARTAPSLAIVDDDALARVADVPGVVIVPRSAFLARTKVPVSED